MAAGPAGLHARPAGAEVNRSGAAARLTGAARMWLESVNSDGHRLRRKDTSIPEAFRR